MKRVVAVAIAGRNFTVTVCEQYRDVWVACGEFADREIATMDHSCDGAVDRWRANAAESSSSHRIAA
jgi:hypothetical protein